MDFTVTAAHNAEMVVDKNNKILFGAFDFDQLQSSMDDFKGFLEYPFGYRSQFILSEYLDMYKVSRESICDEINKVLTSVKSKQADLDKIIVQYNERIKSLNGYQEVLGSNPGLDLTKMKNDFTKIITSWNVSTCYASVDLYR